MIKPGMFISDRYEIIDKVGTGGMADVYKARCHRLNRFVAIKVLKQEYSDDKKFVAKFRGEAQSAAGLSHPNIVNVYDVGEDNGLYYIVMELVEGITLKSFIERKGKLEVKEALGIAIQIAQGMEAAHDNHIIHRDIKPQNIIISREGKVKVTDFGIAKAASSNTITSNAMGSVHYISPEQARGGYSDEKSDIYSLGVTLYEMISGKVPFVGDNAVSVALSHIQEEAIPLRSLDASIPSSVDKIVQKCMQKKPERRYLTASSLISDLKHSIADPNGDFVKIAPNVINDSPTISLSDDEVNHIRNASKAAPYQTTRNTGAIPKTKAEDEDDDDSEVDPKLEKLMFAGGITAAVILAIIIIFLVGKTIGFFGGGSRGNDDPQPSPTAVESMDPDASPTSDAEGLVVPRLIGKTREEAEAALDALGLQPRYTEAPSDLFPEGQVTNQTPEQDTPIEEGEFVDVVISSGSEAFSMPDIYGKPKNEADTALVDAGLVISEHPYEYNDEVEVDCVIRTDPARGSSVSKGDSVKVILSKGPEKKMVLVPDLSNCTEAEAISKLKTAGLSKGKITYTYSNKVEKDLVISQSETVNNEVEKGSKIDFSISLGPEEVATTYKYYGSVTINFNPFEYEDEEGTIKLVLSQNGKKKVVYESVEDMSSFPLNVDGIQGYSESDGTITMYLDDVLVGDTYAISFTKVEE